MALGSATSEHHTCRFLSQQVDLTHTHFPAPPRAAYTAMVLNECDGLTLQGRVREVTLQGAPPFTGAMHADWGLGGALGMLAGITLAFLLAAYITLLPMARIGRL